MTVEFIGRLAGYPKARIGTDVRGLYAAVPLTNGSETTVSFATSAEIVAHIRVTVARGTVRFDLMPDATSGAILESQTVTFAA